MEPAKADREYPLGEIIIKTGKESQKHMADTRTDELYRALQDKGYPDELCREIAYKHMNTDYTATRMLGYLYRVTSPRVEDVIDEMLAILSDREAIIRKKELEHYDSLSQVLSGTVPQVNCNDSDGRDYQPKAAYTSVMSSEDKEHDAFLATDCIGTEKLISGEYNSDVFAFEDSGVRKLLADIQVEEQNHAEMLYKYKTVNGMF